MSLTASRARNKINKQLARIYSRNAKKLKRRLHKAVMCEIKKKIRNNQTFVTVFIDTRVNNDYKGSTIEKKIIKEECEELIKLGYEVEFAEDKWCCTGDRLKISWDEKRRE